MPKLKYRVALKLEVVRKVKEGNPIKIVAERYHVDKGSIQKWLNPSPVPAS